MKTAQINVNHEFFGMVDYWGGNGRRWDDNAGCLFAYVNSQTTLRDCVDQWVEDFICGGDCDSFPAEITAEQIREAILEGLTPQGRQNYADGALCEHARELDPEDDDADESPVWILLVELD